MKVEDITMTLGELKSVVNHLIKKHGEGLPVFIIDCSRTGCQIKQINHAVAEEYLYERGQIDGVMEHVKKGTSCIQIHAMEMYPK